MKTDDPLKWDWKVSWNWSTTDKCGGGGTDEWPDLTHDQAEVKVDALIARHQRQPKFAGIAVRAIGGKPNCRGFSVINKAEWK